MRINKYLARAGIGSRRTCDEYISKGNIKINGEIIKNFSYQVTEDDIVQFKNKYIKAHEKNVYIMLNKPKGFICSKKDNLNRKTIYDLFISDCRLFSVGRLDYDTSGLILLTNDGEFSNFMSHPKNKIKKKYYVLTDKKISKDEVKKIASGVRLVDGDKVRGDLHYLKYSQMKYHWDITLTEGKNREIKRIFKHFDVKVTHIHRYEYASISLNNLKEGKVKYLQNKLINKIIEKYKS